MTELDYMIFILAQKREYENNSGRNEEELKMREGRMIINVLLQKEYFACCSDRIWHSYKYYILNRHMRNKELFVLHQILERDPWISSKFHPWLSSLFSFHIPTCPQHLPLPLAWKSAHSHGVHLTEHVLELIKDWCSAPTTLKIRGVSQVFMGLGRQTLDGS